MNAGWHICSFTQSVMNDKIARSTGSSMTKMYKKRKHSIPLSIQLVAYQTTIEMIINYLEKFFSSDGTMLQKMFDEKQTAAVKLKIILNCLFNCVEMNC